MKNFLIGFVVQFVSYLNLTLNYRAISESRMLFAMGTDAIAVVLAYVIIRKVSRDEECRWTMAGMVLGGSLAAAVGITLTEHWRTP